MPSGKASSCDQRKHYSLSAVENKFVVEAGLALDQAPRESMHNIDREPSKCPLIMAWHCNYD